MPAEEVGDTSIKYHVSRYLNVIHLNKGALLFNGVNGCLDEIPSAIADVLESGTPDKLQSLNREDLDVLLKRGHITLLPPDQELARFKEFTSALHHNCGKEDRHHGIMLLLSYNCNLACKYCYQQEHRPHKSQAVMTPALVESLFEKHLPEIIHGTDLNNFEISLYGGEPFLPANEAAIRKALTYAKKHAMRVSSISNGTMVDSMPDIFGPDPGMVNRVQISLDGSRALHDTSRIPLSGEKTFDRITGNIAMLLARNTRINIRLNLDRRTLASASQLLKELRKRNILGHKYASIYASPLHDNIAEVDATNFMGIADLSSKVLELGVDLEHPVSLRAHEMSYLFNLEKGLGLMHTCFCMQTRQRVLVVDPYGDLYACFEEAGYLEFRVGRLSERGAEMFPLHDTYKTRHIANMDTCLKCSVALACGGQCGVKSRAKTGSLFVPHCEDMKHVILAAIKYSYQKKKQAGGGMSGAPAEESRTVHG